MLFKNLHLYRLTRPLSLSPEELDARLRRNLTRPSSALEPVTYGWAKPLGRDGVEYVHAANGCVMVCARREAKVVPPATLRALVDEKVAALEAEGHTVPRRWRQRLQDETFMEVARNALASAQDTFAYLTRDWLVVDAASARKAEDLAGLLRQSLGSLPAVVPALRENPVVMMTRWLAGRELMPAGFLLGTDCELVDPERHGATVRLRNMELRSEEVQRHLLAGKRVRRLALSLEDEIRFTLGADLSVTGLRFGDAFKDQVAEVEADDAAARFDADFALMTLELGRFLPRLLAGLGGEDTSAYQAAA